MDAGYVPAKQKLAIAKGHGKDRRAEEIEEPDPGRHSLPEEWNERATGRMRKPEKKWKSLRQKSTDPD